MVNPVPDGFSTLTPHVIVKGAGEAIELYKAAFGAEEMCRMNGPGGMVMHCELKIGNSMMMLAEEFPGMGMKNPKDLGETPVAMHLYVDDADAAFQRAVDAGCTPLMPVQEMFWGDRYGKVQDTYGHHWSIATHVKDVTPEEMEAAMAAAMGGAGPE